MNGLIEGVFCTKLKVGGGLLLSFKDEGNNMHITPS